MKTTKFHVLLDGTWFENDVRKVAKELSETFPILWLVKGEDYRTTKREEFRLSRQLEETVGTSNFFDLWVRFDGGPAPNQIGKYAYLAGKTLATNIPLLKIKLTDRLIIL